MGGRLEGCQVVGGPLGAGYGAVTLGLGRGVKMAVWAWPWCMSMASQLAEAQRRTGTWPLLTPGCARVPYGATPPLSQASEASLQVSGLTIS